MVLALCWTSSKCCHKAGNIHSKLSWTVASLGCRNTWIHPAGVVMFVYNASWLQLQNVWSFTVSLFYQLVILLVCFRKHVENKHHPLAQSPSSSSSLGEGATSLSSPAFNKSFRPGWVEWRGNTSHLLSSNILLCALPFLKRHSSSSGVSSCSQSAQDGSVLCNACTCCRAQLNTLQNRLNVSNSGVTFLHHL